MANSELAYHPRRVVDMITSFRTHFPRVPVAWKLAHPRWNEDLGSVDNTDLNGAIESYWSSCRFRYLSVIAVEVLRKCRAAT